MHKFKTLAFLISMAIAVTGCGRSPGPLEGVWRAAGLVPMKITFRSGETEALGIIEHVEYRVEGNSVTVTYKDGLMKGSAMRYTMVDHDTAQNPLMTLKRVQ
jgi:hypothetical protein